MITGALGGMVFQVSSNTAKTISNLQWSGSAQYATHARHGQSALEEFVGTNSDKLSFDVYLSSSLGVNPQHEIMRIAAYTKSAALVSLIVGGLVIGSRWVVESYKVKAEHYGRGGAITHATVSVSLLGYSKH